MNSTFAPLARRIPKPLIVIVALALLLTATRLHALLSFPAFVDESWHIGFTQEVLSGHLIAGAAHGKLLVPLLWAALFPTGAGQLFIARAATGLCSLITFALVYRLACDLIGRRAGIVAALLYIASPYLLFYERMALMDTYMMTFGLLAIWSASRLRQRQQWQDALWCGLALAGALAVKGTGVALVIVPLCALALGFGRYQWRAILRWTIVCYGAFGLIWVPLYLFLRWRHIDYFGLAETLSNTGSQTNFSTRLVNNVLDLVRLNAVYFSAPGLLIALGLSILWIRDDVRRGLFVVLSAALPTGIILLLSPFDRARYLIYATPLLIIAAVGGGAWVWHTLVSRMQPEVGLAWRVTGGAVIIIGVLGLGSAALPFFETIYTAPAALNLPIEDKIEYVSAESAGFTLPDIAAFLRSRPTLNAFDQDIASPIRVIGLLANCGGLQLYLAQTPGITLDCPPIAWDGSSQNTIAALVNQSAQSKTLTYVVIEPLPYISRQGISVPFQVLRTFTRPGGVTSLTVYAIGAGPN